MFRLDDVDLEFGEDEDTFSLSTVSNLPAHKPRPPSPVADESAGRLSFGFQSVQDGASETSSADIFDSPRCDLGQRAQERGQRERSPVRVGLRSPLRTRQETSRSMSVEKTPRSEGKKRKTLGKLPGPAGTLPRLAPNMDVNSMNHRLKAKRTSPLRPSQPTPSQLSQEEDAWSVARADIGPILWPAFRRNCIAAVIAKATRRALSARGKVPCMCVQLEEISVESVDARVLLKDSSGSMKGTLHREALRSFKAHLKIGAVMVLKLVSVFSPTPKTHYLNITLPNLVQLYDTNAPLLPPSPTRPRLSPDQVHGWESACAALPATPPLNRIPRQSTPLFQGPQPSNPAYRGPGPPLRFPRPSTPVNPVYQSSRPPLPVPSPSVSVARGFECLLDDDMDDLLASSMLDDVMDGSH